MNPLRYLIPCGGAILSLMSGCTSLKTEMGRPLHFQPGAFIEGQTRVEAVVASLGPPHRASALTPGFTFLYEHSRVNEFQVSVPVYYSFLRFFKFVHAWNHLDQEAFLLTFDDQGVLRSVGARKWRENLGGGNAIQFLVSVVSLSDVSKVLRPDDAHAWGGTLRHSPPVTLNSRQTLRTGEHGLQQRTAPDYAGQQALEMTRPKTEKEKRRAKRAYQDYRSGP